MGAGGLEMRQPATADGDGGGGGGGGPVGAGTPAAPSIPYPPWSREGRSFFRETPAGGATSAGWHRRQTRAEREDEHEGGRGRGYGSTAPERADGRVEEEGVVGGSVGEGFG